MRFFLLALVCVAVFAAALAPAARADYRAVVLDGHSGEVLISKGAKKEHAPASLTKMMTALVAAEQSRRGELITVGNYRPRLDEQQLGLRRGEKITRDDLLKAALINSSNDAAVALADGSGSRARFLRRMNEKAKELGLSDSHFIHPAGMDRPGQQTTALDMARLGRQLMLDKELAAIVARPDAWLMSGRERRYITATNRLLGGPVDGIKTGYTNKAGFSIVTSSHKGKRWVVAAVLGADSSEERFAAADSLMERGLNKIKRRSLGRRGQFVATIAVAYNRPAQIKLARSASVWTASKAPVRERLVGLPESFEGPMAAGTRVGTIEYYLGREKRGQSPLVLANSLTEPSFLQKLLADLPLLPLAVVILLFGAAYWFLERRRPAR